MCCKTNQAMNSQTLQRRARTHARTHTTWSRVTLALLGSFKGAELSHRAPLCPSRPVSTRRCCHPVAAALLPPLEEPGRDDVRRCHGCKTSLSWLRVEVTQPQVSK